MWCRYLPSSLREVSAVGPFNSNVLKGSTIALHCYSILALPLANIISPCVLFLQPFHDGMASSRDAISKVFAAADTRLEQDFAGSGNPRLASFDPNQTLAPAGGEVDLDHVPQEFQPERHSGEIHLVVVHS